MTITEIQTRLAEIGNEQRMLHQSGNTLKSAQLTEEATRLNVRLKNEKDRQWRTTYNAPLLALADGAVAAMQSKQQAAQQDANDRQERAIKESARLAYIRTNGNANGFDEAWPRIRQSMAVEAATKAATAQIGKGSESEIVREVVAGLTRRYTGKRQ